MARRDRPPRFRLESGSTGRFFEVRQVVLPAPVLTDLIPGAEPEANKVGELTAMDVRRASEHWSEGRPALEMQSAGFRWIRIEPEDSVEEFELLCLTVIPTKLGVALQWHNWALEVEESAVGKMCFFVVYARVAPPQMGGKP